MSNKRDIWVQSIDESWTATGDGETIDYKGIDFDQLISFLDKIPDSNPEGIPSCMGFTGKGNENVVIERVDDENFWLSLQEKKISRNQLISFLQEKW
ncbi:MAG: hypothetical protein GF383_12225 [Candidatus Lokiarchaeota archaeon]|nr:hypothetical protein [Candidatus Lokiarchaeota archaeon]MBD3341759.1 hypothetical protein [Candidatus Lokiarchaeota archaeon]